MKFLKATVIVMILMSGLTNYSNAQTQTESTVVFLVRHAEKESDSKDPELNTIGKERAQQLADVLASAELDFILSSDFKRTRDTAKPTSEKQSIATTIYDVYDLPGLVESIKSKQGRYLVVGHSNTTPKVVELLGGEPGDPIVEKTEYDRLYVLTLQQDGSVTTVLLRY